MSLLAIDRPSVVEWYQRNRARTRAIFDLIDPSAYYSRPIALRNPIVFYEGHLPAFSAIAFLERGLGRPPVDGALERLFARGIDPQSEADAVPRSGASTRWPSRDEVLAFARACDAAVIDAIAREPLAIEGLYTALEHEAMHQETLLYMWHRVPYGQKRGLPPDQPWPGLRRSAEALRAKADGGSVAIPAGTATLGVSRDRVVFGWDNEFDAHRVHVPAFEIDVHNVTNADYLDFVSAGGYERREWWDAAGWQWVQEERVRHPAFWTRGADGGGWC